MKSEQQVQTLDNRKFELFFRLSAAVIFEVVHAKNSELLAVALCPRLKFETVGDILWCMSDNVA
jgi:hypothetical protein